MQAGTPQVVLPLHSFDHKLWSSLVERAGIGVCGPWLQDLIQDASASERAVPVIQELLADAISLRIESSLQKLLGVLAAPPAGVDVAAVRLGAYVHAR